VNTRPLNGPRDRAAKRCGPQRILIIRDALSACKEKNSVKQAVLLIFLTCAPAGRPFDGVLAIKHSHLSLFWTDPSSKSAKRTTGATAGSWVCSITRMAARTGMRSFSRARHLICVAFPYDQSFKLLGDEDTLGLMKDVAGIRVSASAVIESLDRELNLERLHADHLYRVRDRRRECIHHFEALTTYHSGWEKAQLDHAIYVELKYGLPVVSHLLLLSQPGAPRSIPERVIRVSGSVRYSLKVNVIRLWRRPAAAVLAAERVAVYPWTALMDATVKEHQEAARRVRVTGREDLQMQMALMGALRYGSREAFFERIGRMLLTKDILRESPLWQEIERDGEAKGRAEGEAKALRRSIRVFLLGRFGPLPEWVGERLDGAGTEDLELWLNRTATATSLASVFE
jgi:hypothetical protein